MVEKLSDSAKALVKTLAYSPQTGYTIASSNDTRPAVKVQPVATTFTAAAEAAGLLEKEEW